MDGTGRTTIEVKQESGAVETLARARTKFEQDNPTLRAVNATFEYAYPARPGEGRWVGITIEHVCRGA